MFFIQKNASIDEINEFFNFYFAFWDTAFSQLAFCLIILHTIFFLIFSSCMWFLSYLPWDITRNIEMFLLKFWIKHVLLNLLNYMFDIETNFLEGELYFIFYWKFHVFIPKECKVKLNSNQFVLCTNTSLHSFEF